MVLLQHNGIIGKIELVFDVELFSSYNNKWLYLKRQIDILLKQNVFYKHFTE